MNELTAFAVKMHEMNARSTSRLTFMYRYTYTITCYLLKISNEKSVAVFVNFKENNRI